MSAWTPERDKVLRACAARGDSFEVCAAELKVTRSAVAGRAHRLGVKFRGNPCRPWSANQTARMWRLTNQGLTSAEIGRRLGRTRNAVLKHRCWVRRRGAVQP